MASPRSIRRRNSIPTVAPLSRPWRRLVGGSATVALLTIGLLAVVAAPASAAGTRAFTSIYSGNTTGNILIRGNTLMTCPSGSTGTGHPPTGNINVSCATAQGAGSWGRDNDFNMGYVDTDGNPATFDSSSATVAIPPGATVLFAALMWSGETTAGGGGSAPTNGSADGTADFMTPGTSSYVAETSPTVDTASDGSASPYQSVAVVTSAVRAAGAGTYTVGEVQGGTGSDRYAGWALAIAYDDPTQPVRNLDIFSGFGDIDSGNGGQSVTVNGFATPSSGKVSTEVGVVAWEGDRGNVGDGLSVAGTSLSNAVNPVNDVFNSTISDLGVDPGTRTPNYANTLGTDIDTLDATGALANGATSAVVTMTTLSSGGETYFPGLLTFATNLNAPSLTATKTVTDATGTTVAPGDRLNYSINVTNNGDNGSKSSVLTDTVPTGTTYVAGTLTIGGVSLTDAAGDDAGEVVAGVVTARMGTGASASVGGQLAVGASTTVAFGVTVNSGDTNGTLLSNTAALAYADVTTNATLIGSSDTVTSTVNGPTLAFSTPPGGQVNAAYTDTLTGSGGTTPYTWSLGAGTLPAGLTLSSSGVISGTPTTAGTSDFTAVMTDHNGRIATEATSITVTGITLAFSTPPSGEVTLSYSDTFAATGGTSPYTYASSGTLPAGLSLSSAGVLSGTPTAGGTSSFTVTATDHSGATASQLTSVTILAPVLTTTPAAGELNVAYSATFAASGGDAPYTYATSNTLPAGLTLSSAGVLAGTPTAVGTTSFTVTATDSAGVTAADSTSLTIVARPSLTFAAPPSGEVGVAYTDAFTESGGISPFTWMINGGTVPAGLTLVASTGVLSGTPTSSGTSSFTVTVTDVKGKVASQATSITVTAGPALTSTPPGGEVGAVYATTLTATGGASPYTYARTLGSLPAGLSLSSAGLISGTPTAAGPASFTVTATDSNGQTATDATSITVVAGPSLTSSPPGGEVGVTYATTFTATGGASPYTYARTAGSLPAGLSLSSAGVISGIPSAAGSPSFTVRATDSNGQTATDVTSITVVAGPALTTTPPSGEVGVLYISTFSASGGTSPYTYAKTAGSLPAGLSLSAAGVISGIPTGAGSPSFTVTATDNNGQTAADATSITVIAGPVLTYGAPPVEVIGTYLSDTLTASGGTTPYQWMKGTGSLPAGVSLGFGTGVLSGTPTVAGTFHFTVEVTDAGGQSDTKATTLVIDPAAVLSVSASSVNFGTSITVTDTISPAAATGSVTFTDLVSSGPEIGQTLTLGTTTLSSGSAAPSFTLPAFGTNTIIATYGGDSTYPSIVSLPTLVQVNAFQDEVLVDQFRLSGPSGANDQYVQLYNAGPAVSLAGFTLASSSGASFTVPVTAPVVPKGHSYLITGASYSLGDIATSDASTNNLGSSGLQVTAPDQSSTVVDAVGSVGAGNGFFRGTALPALSGTPTDQYAWVRLEVSGAPENTGVNNNDFKLVSTTAGVIGGVQSTLGSPAPLASGSPVQSNATLRSTLLGPTKASNAAPNFVYVKGTPGLLTVRRTITNTTGATVTSAEVRITSLSEANGAPEPGVTTQPTTSALLRLIDPATATSSVTTAGGVVTVENLSPNAPSAVSPGGGLDTTLTVSLPSGLAPGASVNIAFSFAVDQHGPYWFGYDIDALTGASQGQARHDLRSKPSGHRSHRLVPRSTPQAASGRGVLR